MNARRDVHAVVPIKDTNDAKRRLAGVLGAPRRRELALAMFEDVLATLSRVRELAGIVVVTAGPAAAAIARRYGARVSRQGAHDGHSGAVAAAARRLASHAIAHTRARAARDVGLARERRRLQPSSFRLMRTDRGISWRPECPTHWEAGTPPPSRAAPSRRYRFHRRRRRSSASIGPRRRR